MEIGVEKVTVHTKRTFTIFRSSSDSFEEVVLRLEEDGFSGLGEAAPTGYYGQNAEEVAEALEGVEVRDAWDVEGTLRLNSNLPPSALAALDSALHDLAARRLGVPLYRLLGLARPATQSAYTLGIADPETTLEEAKRLSEFPILKMKVGSRRDVETVRAVREVCSAELWVDANEAFSPEEAVEVVRELKGIGVSLIEQPVAVSEGPGALRAASRAAGPVPVIADESAVVASDVPPLAGCVSGVNVKLAKCGGIRGALALVAVARAHGMRPMLGCMVETSVGIAAAASISGLFDFVDLDGAMLLADDPFSGPSYENGRILLPQRPGIGTEEAKVR